MDDRPEMRYINRHIKEEICASGAEAWLRLGTELLEEKDVKALYAIKSDSPECSMRCSEMFKLWLERQPGASWRRLIQALKQIDMNKLASDVEKLLVKEQTGEQFLDQVSQGSQHARPSPAVGQPSLQINGPGCHSCTFCTIICDRGKNRSQESSIKSQLVKGQTVLVKVLGQQPMCYASTATDTNVVDEDLRFSLWGRITCKMLVCRKLCYSQSSAENLWVKGQVSFSAKVKGQGPS